MTAKIANPTLTIGPFALISVEGIYFFPNSKGQRKVANATIECENS